MNDSYIKYLKSDKWKEFRKSILDARPHCEKCLLPRKLSRFFYGTDLDIHHLHYKNIFHEKREDVKVLCRGCHEIAELPKRWPEVCTFSGTPQFYLKCPICGYHLTVGIEHLQHQRHIGQEIPLYECGPIFADGCICEIGDAKEYVLENIKELMEAKSKQLNA